MSSVVAIVSRCENYGENIPLVGYQFWEYCCDNWGNKKFINYVNWTTSRTIGSLCGESKEEKRSDPRETLQKSTT